MPYYNYKINMTGIEGTQQYYGNIKHIMHLPGGQRIITYSYHGLFRVWDLETGAQVGEEWEDKEIGGAIALSPDGKTIASGSKSGAVRLLNIVTGEVIREWTGHTEEVRSLCWSSDGGRVVSGSEDGTFTVWSVESGRIILRPIKAGEYIYAVCYSPNAKMIATGGDSLKIWDANTGKLLTTIKGFVDRCLVWTSNGKTLIAGKGSTITKFDTVTWTETAVLQVHHMNEQPIFGEILLSPNARILAVITGDTVSKIARLWNLKTNQRIWHQPLYLEGNVMRAAISADEMFLAIGCSGIDGHIYKWDLSAIIKDTKFLSNNLSSSRTQSHGTQFWSSPFRWTRSLVSGMVRRRNEDIEPEPPIVYVSCNRRKEPTASSSQHVHAHPSQQPPPTATASALPAVAGAAGTTGTIPFNQLEATECGTQPRSSPFSWTRNLVSGMVRRRNEDIELPGPPIVDVPVCMGKPVRSPAVSIGVARKKRMYPQPRIEEER